MPPTRFAQRVLSAGNLLAERLFFKRLVRPLSYLTAVIAVCMAVVCNGEPTNSVTLADQAYRAAKSAWETNSNSLEVGWRFARACYDRADVALSDSERISFAREGIAAARQVVQYNPQSAAAHYYLSMNLGQVALIKRMAALRMVDEMEAEFEKTRLLDEKFDYAGADRCLGLLYRDAPGWPLSIGNRSKARQHLVRAAELDPNYPENHLVLVEAYIKWGDWSKAAQQASKYEALLPEAKMRFSGAAWEHDWAGWDQLWKTLEQKLSQKLKPDWRKSK